MTSLPALGGGLPTCGTRRSRSVDGRQSGPLAASTQPGGRACRRSHCNGGEPPCAEMCCQGAAMAVCSNCVRRRSRPMRRRCDKFDHCRGRACRSGPCRGGAAMPVMVRRVCSLPEADSFQRRPCAFCRCAYCDCTACDCTACDRSACDLCACDRMHMIALCTLLLRT